MRFNFLDKVTPANRILDRASKVAERVIEREEHYSKFTLDQLREETNGFIQRLQSNEVTLDDILVEALAVIREAFWQVYGMKAYKVQLIGAIIVYFGDFAEMMTGEGKTLTLVLASYVGSLVKKGVHIVSVNEYLVQRDAEFSAGVLNKLGLTVGYIKSSMNPDEKRANYNCDVTYCSNSELGFDYLRDNMVKNFTDKVQRGLHFAIVDEADSILIDEARTPLIISGSPANDITDYIQVDRFVKTLEPTDYLIDNESNSITLSDEGAIKAEKYFNIENIYDLEFSDKIHKISNALRANYLFSNGNEYIVKKDKDGQDVIALVDHFTGRIMEGRSYSAGLQQAIQAKEMVEIEPENLTVATITYQSLFRQYTRLSGVSGTAATEAEEMLNIYNMVVVKIPTNKPVIRLDQPDYVFSDKKTKWKYVIAEVIKRHKTGQPILIGTAAVEDSEILHLLLLRVGIPHQVLNAKNHAQEAEIIKNAGQRGQVTIATYMAGRGTDIKLGEGVRELGGLYVIGTERNESRRVDNQLRGRAGRQGDPGESRFFISLQDTLFKRFATDKFQKANQKMDDEVIDLKFFSRLLDNTQKRVEGLNYDTRKNLIDYDHVLSSQRELIYKQRDKVLLSNNLLPLVKKMSTYVVAEIINRNRDEINRDSVNVKGVVEEFNSTVFNEELLDYEELKKLKINYLSDKIQETMDQWLTHKQEELLPENFNNFVKNLLISNIDEAWTQHLDAITKLREGVNLRAYEQKSPLNIYVEDADKLFNELKRKIAIRTVKAIGNYGKVYEQQNSNSPFIIAQADASNQDNSIRELINQTNREYIKYAFNDDDKRFVWEMVLPPNNQDDVKLTDIDQIITDFELNTEEDVFA